MDKCKHVGRLRLAQDHSILNPQKWHCVDCNTTESVWACLGCSHVACGRYIEEHALQHFKESEHPVALEVNELYVFCYLCDDYVLNDNATGDLKLLRSTLSAIKSQNYDCTTRSGRTLRSMAASDDAYPTHGGAQAMLQNEDRMFTALWHRRHALMGRVFRSWFEKTTVGQQRLAEEKRLEQEEQKKEVVRNRRKELKRQLKAEFENTPPRKSSRLQKGACTASSKLSSTVPQKAPQKPAMPLKSASSSKVEEVRLKKIGDSPSKRRPTVTPGVTGLRNLGNTCYMNSILQILSHLNVFRECFLKLDLNQAQELLPSTPNGKTSSKQLAVLHSFHSQGKHNQVKVEVARRPSLSSGLSGGASNRRTMELIQPKEPSSKHISLCHELHTLFQVMWSGKWALVSPFAMLHSVWRLIPAFRGYAQQDAQEFLCELLDKVQQELETAGARYQAIIPTSQKRLIAQVLNVVNTIFQGQLLSQTHETQNCGIVRLGVRLPHGLENGVLRVGGSARNPHPKNYAPNFVCESARAGSVALPPSPAVPHSESPLLHTHEESITHTGHSPMQAGPSHFVLKTPSMHSRWKTAEMEKEGRPSEQNHKSSSKPAHLVKRKINEEMKVTCLACDNKSNTVEPFWDLSLEFPERYHCSGKDTASQHPCLLTEMLAKFTETEALEGKIYACDLCNTKRRKFSSKPVILTEAQKQLMVCQLPQVLRLHLKRFRWSGRNNREKIGVHVSFGQMLNMEPYCCRESTKTLRPECFIYDLSAVVMHHGKGFGSGHYTAFCYNPEGGFWVHCNDSKLNICSVEEVCNVQAYILFYTQRVPQENGHACPGSPSTSSAPTEMY